MIWTPPGEEVEDHSLPLVGQMYSYVHEFSSSDDVIEAQKELRPEALTESIENANLITSAIASNILTHKVVLDLDLPAKLIPSTTPDHYHLYIDHAMPWENYLKLLKVMVECGLVEEGYVGAAERRGYTGVRLPWVKKEKKPE